MIKFWVYLFFLIVISIQDVESDRTSLKIYENIQSDIFCFRRLNATHQIGCASHRSGNVGVLFVIEGQEELNNITENEPTMPFVVAIPMDLFNMKNMKLLRQSKNIRGTLLFKPKTMKPLKFFSPDQSCPNRNYGFYTDKINQEYAACKKKEWNKLPKNEALGMMFEDWEMPIFVITNETHIESIKNCYSNFNNNTNEWPLCSVQMTSVMLAAKDSDTCMRRNKLIANLNEVKNCDPLSDKNILYTLFSTNKSEVVDDKSIVILSARLDSFSMFDKLAPGAHSTVTGLVTLLTVAKNMVNLKKKIVEKLGSKPAKNILFIIFNGEAFDYIGSSRVVYDMKKNDFPVKILKGIREQPALIKLEHISHFIELSQLAPVEEPIPLLYVHTDPVSVQQNNVSDAVKHLVDLFKSESKRSGSVNVSEAPPDIPLPPASFQSFLKHDKSIPGIVIADHVNEYINRYYNSIFDSNETLDASSLTDILSEISSAVSGTLYQLLTNEQLDQPVETDKTLVSGLLDCYLQNASCPLFRQIADPLMTERLRVEPYPLYVSVDSGGPSKANAITLYTRYLLAYLTGTEVPDLVRGNCTGDVQNQIYQFDWMAGNEENATGVCIKSRVIYTIAQSPAYVLNDWKSTEYSTWTESIWLETSARIFVQPGKVQEALTLIAGLIIFALSIGSVYFVNERSSIIFNTKPLVGC
ncbi:nicastrin-like [Uloborus diversus]|uniref:nicastrin-like n=1 Tax=Uloborus diversus TaxID=327109 RepID=UPI002409B4E6|nr:nicastrin-like [Uloborus diversus]